MYAQWVVLGIMPYLTVFILIYGLCRRLRRWSGAAAGRSVLYTAGAGTAAPAGGLFAGNRPLWFATVCLHAVLLLVLAGHTRVLLDFPWLWSALGLSGQEVDALAGLLGGLAGLLLLAAVLGLLARRLLVVRIREISGPGEWAALVLLLGVVLTGDLLRFDPSVDLAAIREQLPGALLLRPGPALKGTCFLLHAFLAQTLVLFLPFGNLVHIVGIFFSKPLLSKKWDGCQHACREC